jgi:hypothetical protein
MGCGGETVAVYHDANSGRGRPGDQGVPERSMLKHVPSGALPTDRGQSSRCVSCRLRCRLLNHYSTWFIKAAMDGYKVADKTKMGCQPSLNLLWMLARSRTRNTRSPPAGISRLRLASKVRNSAWRFRRAVRAVTFPVRVSTAVNRWRTPAR